MLHSNPRSAALRQCRQSMSNRQGLAFNSMMTWFASAASMIFSVSTS